MGHTPFGHGGERSLAEEYPGFSHNKQSLRVVDELEKDGKGLNLTWEVRDGILNHSGGCYPGTLEGKVVHLSDRIAYINHDIDDAIRAGIITQEQLPEESIIVLGQKGSKRIDTMVRDVVQQSADLKDIVMSASVGAATERLREFLFDQVYWRPAALEEEEKVKQMIHFLCQYYQQFPQELPQGAKGDIAQRVCDYIAGMTDRFALEHYHALASEG